jgi:hypothetical protein
MTNDYLRYYHLEQYLFEDVRMHFFRDEKLDAFDLFSIIIWKANRAKSMLARRLIRKSGNLESAAEQFTRALFEAPSPQARLLVAMKDWGFYLPMASAILSVLWPDDFTLYDIRVCDELRKFHVLANSNADRVWSGYEEYREAVKNAVPGQKLLRDKDRLLWGQSASKQLVRDLATCFTKPRRTSV